MTVIITCYEKTEHVSIISHQHIEAHKINLDENADKQAKNLHFLSPKEKIHLERGKLPVNFS